MRRVLETNNLEIGYGRNIVASGIDTMFSMGELTAVIGANGSGKSTFLRTITGVQPALSGNIRIGKKNLNELTRPDLAREISVVLTEKIPAAELTVFELTALGRQPYTNWLGKLSTDDMESVEMALARTGIAHLKNKKFHQLSDGQLQHVLIARALAQQTGIIVLDEPTTHLDLPRKAAIFTLLRELAENGKCIIFSTHDLELAYALSDRLLLFTDNGVACGTPEELAKSGALARLFEKDGIGFDADAVKFTFARK